MDYKDFSPEQSTNDHPEKKQSFFKPFLFGFLGGLLAIVLFIIFIVQQDFFDVGMNEKQEFIEKQKDKNVETKIDISNETMDLSEITKSVVGVVNLQQTSLWEQGEMAGTGSGIIYKKEDKYAYVVTNNHVIEHANEVEIEMYDETRLEADVIGTDKLTDLAVLRIDGENINHIATFGKSEDLTLGEDVIAIGNPLSLNLSGSVTRGIISGLNRSVPVDTSGDRIPDWINEVIQTDAAINPGNSGGALVNKNGEVIGINSMKIAQTEVEGIGFAIPIDAALPIIEELESSGKVERPFIGIGMVDLTAVPKDEYNNLNIPKDLEKGVIVASIEPNSPADKANIEKYDIITKINNYEVESFIDLRQYLYTDVKPGEKLNIELYRNGKKMTSTLKLTQLHE